MKSKMAAYHCCVPLCVSDSRKEEPEISFHGFPSEPKRRAEWIVKIRRDPGDLFKVCLRQSHLYFCSRCVTLAVNTTAYM